MQASAKVTTPNAYVTGLAGSKRIVVWDTSLSAHQSPSPEVLWMVGHECGHYVLGHVWKGTLLTLAGLPPGVAGLLAKFLALRPLADQGLWWVALPAVIAAVVGLAVYLRWVALVLRPEEGPRAPEDVDTTATVVAVVTGLVLLAATLAPVVLLGAGTT